MDQEGQSDVTAEQTDNHELTAFPEDVEPDLCRRIGADKVDRPQHRTAGEGPDLARGVIGRAVDRGERTRVQRRLAFFGVDVDDDRILAVHGLHEGEAHQPEPAGADQHDRVVMDDGPELA